MFSPEQLKPHLPPIADGCWWVALSGGLDSCVLLHSLAALKLPVTLKAIHINHQISPNANSWQAHCEALCASLGVPCVAVRVNVVPEGRGLEDAARAARYEVFTQQLQAGDCLLMAHHGDDQAETLLLRLMRGAGPRGLSAMAAQRPLGAGYLIRPLLNFTRADLETYAQQQGLRWVTDESNLDDHYDRNFLRNQVMPRLRERWPGFTQKWQQAANLCADSDALAEDLAALDMQQAGWRSEALGSSLELAAIQALSPVRRYNLLRHWLRHSGHDLPEQQHLQQLDRQLLNHRQDAETQVNWGDTSLRVFRDRLYLLSLSSLPAHLPVLPEFSPDMSLGQGYRLRAPIQAAAEGVFLRNDLPDLHLAYRQGGERCRPVGRRHSQTLKRLLQEYGVPTWLRDTLPLIYSGDQLVAVADLWICEGYQAQGRGYCLKYGRFDD